MRFKRAYFQTWEKAYAVFSSIVRGVVQVEIKSIDGGYKVSWETF